MGLSRNTCSKIPRKNVSFSRNDTNNDVRKHLCKNTPRNFSCQRIDTNNDVPKHLLENTTNDSPPTAMI